MYIIIFVYNIYIVYMYIIIYILSGHIYINYILSGIQVFTYSPRLPKFNPSLILSLQS